MQQKFHVSFISDTRTCEMKLEQNYLNNSEIVLQLFQAHLHIFLHAENYANAKIVSGSLRKVNNSVLRRRN